MKVGFYLENRNIKQVDLSRPQKGNPGCGGTEFLFAALPYYLAEKLGNRCAPVILANYIENLPDNVQALQVSDAYQAARAAKNGGCDIFVYRPRRIEQSDVLELIEELKLPTIGWAHITPTTPYLRKMAETIYFKALVCVEHEQYDQAQDSPVCRKLTYIVNGFDVDSFRLEQPPEKDLRSVVYLGALVPQKGFHLLAKTWPRILKRIPDSKLTVIGTGQLYDEGATLGPWGIAESTYETEKIIPYLAGKDGKPHPSVYFAGKLGCEKKEILHRALIGVPNPTGNTENCPGSSLEFQACGSAIVSRGYYGLLDTVVHGTTGLLGNTEKDLCDNICTLLADPQLACHLGKNGISFVRDKYNWDGVTSKWVTLFDGIISNKTIHRIPFKSNILKHHKILIALNRPIQLSLGRFFKWPSVIEIKESVKLKLTGIIS